jgi:hypothetical protein
MVEIRWIEISKEQFLDKGGYTTYVTTHVAEAEDGILLRTIASTSGESVSIDITHLPAPYTNKAKA